MYLTFKLHRFFGDEKRLANPLQTLSFPLSLSTLHLSSYLQTLYITNVSSEGEPRHLIIYHYITVYTTELALYEVFMVFERNCACRMCELLNEGMVRSNLYIKKHKLYYQVFIQIEDF